MAAAGSPDFELYLAAPSGPLRDRVAGFPIMEMLELKLSSGPRMLALARRSTRVVRLVHDVIVPASRRLFLTLTSWNGQDILLEEAARLSQPEAVVELMCAPFPKDTSYVEQLQRRASRPDLDGRVRFLGRPEDPLARMRAWALAVLASVEPQGALLAPLEAMSIGLPVVGTDHGGTPEDLKDAGLLVPPGDPESMAEAIDRLLGDERLWQDTHEHEPRRVSRGLRLEDQMDALLQVLRDA